MPRLRQVPGARDTDDAAAKEKLDAANRQAGDAIQAYIEAQGLTITGLTVTFDATSSTVSIFGVAADPYTYGSLFYMLLAMATGIFYFTWVVTGASVSVGLLILIIGIPLLLLFLMSVRLLSLVEGRIVEVLLGVRMPRRPLYTQRGKTWLARIGEMFTDLRTWSAMLYLLLMMPLGIAYFTLVVTLVSVSLGLIVSPLSLVFPAWK